jgi:hypothetical protein
MVKFKYIGRVLTVFMKYLAIMAFLVMVKVVSFKAFVVNVK